MWENATPLPPPQASFSQKAPRSKRKKDGDFVVWGQFLIALAAVLFTWIAIQLKCPFLPTLRAAFDKAMQPEQSLLLADERDFSKFTEKVQETISHVTLTLENQLGRSSEKTIYERQSHNKSTEVPAGARNSSYLPTFPLLFPIAGSAVTETSGYGWRADPMGGSGSDFHLGNDLAAEEGTPVLAAADGIVRIAGTHNSYGNYIRILHENGDETLYAHLQYLFVHAGEFVHAGACLGTVGQTGQATGPHLHFEILHKGIRYDPSEALQNAS